MCIRDRFSYAGFAKMGCKKICKIFASEFGFKLGAMRCFQKDIILGGTTSGSVRKVSVGGWGGGWLDYRVSLSPYWGFPWPFRDISVTFPWHFRDISVTFPWRLRRQESVGRQVATIILHWHLVFQFSQIIAIKVGGCCEYVTEPLQFCSELWLLLPWHWD